MVIVTGYSYVSVYTTGVSLFYTIFIIVTCILCSFFLVFVFCLLYCELNSYYSMSKPNPNPVYLKLPTLKFRRVRGDMIEVYKFFNNNIYDSATTGWLTDRHMQIWEFTGIVFINLRFDIMIYVNTASLTELYHYGTVCQKKNCFIHYSKTL